MNHGNESKKCGRGIAIAVAIAILLGTLLPLFGNTAQASVMGTSETTTDGATNPEPLSLWSRVYGTVKYANKNLNGDFLNPDVPIDERYLPIRFARVDLFSYYSVSGDEFYDQTTNTDSAGYFSFDLDSHPIDIEYFVRVYSENQYAAVKDSSLYSNDSDIITVPAYDDSSYLIEFSSYPDHPAWNILDSVTEAAEWVKERTKNQQTPDGWTRGKITVIYPVIAQNSHHHSDINEIHIINGDEWNDNIIYHEYGHAIMAWLYDFDAPSSEDGHGCGVETTWECAISEGWAYFIGFSVSGGDYGYWDPTKTKTTIPWMLEYGSGNIQKYTTAYHIHLPLPFGDAFIDFLDSNSNNVYDCDMDEGNFGGIMWDIFDDPYTFDCFFQ